MSPTKYYSATLLFQTSELQPPHYCTQSSDTHGLSDSSYLYPEILSARLHCNKNRIYYYYNYLPVEDIMVIVKMDVIESTIPAPSLTSTSVL